MPIKKKTYQYVPLFILFTVCILFADSVKAQAPLVSVSSANFKTYDIIRAGRLGGDQEFYYTSRDVVIKQERTYFYADSISLNKNTGLLEAFGRVHINDADSVHIYTNYLRYKGKERTAFLKGNVKVTDGTSVLTTDQLDYDMNTSIGVYTKGGKLVNGKTVLTSTRGTYYGDTRDVTFSKNVLLEDPQYRITSDSLLYNTSTRIANFVVPTNISSGSDRKIITQDGYYNMDTRQAYFGTRSTIVDSTTTLIADEVAYDDRNGFGEARGNAILRDSAQGIVVIANNIKTNKTESAFLATVNPLAIMAQDGDSTYLAADTIYSGRLTDRVQGINFKNIDSAKDSVVIDSVNYNIAENIDPEIREHIREDLLPENNTAAKNTQSRKDDIKKNDLSQLLNADPQSSPNLQTNSVTDSLPARTDSIVNPANKGKATPSALDYARRSTADSAAVSRTARAGMPDFSLPSATSHEVGEEQEDDKKNRFVEAYYRVRIYNDSLQAVGDSMFFSSQDSIFRLLKNPVVWSNASDQFLQLTGDTIFVHTQNRKPKKIDVWKNALAISQPLVNGRVAENNFYYNQIAGNYLFINFTEGQLDSLQARYNVENVYYLLDEENKYAGVNKQKSEILDIYFKEKQVDKIVSRVDVTGTTFPMGQVDHNSIRLSNYKLHNDLRPKSKYDLFAPEITEQPEPAEAIETQTASAFEK